jgi:hypothetical protein
MAAVALESISPEIRIVEVCAKAQQEDTRTSAAATSASDAYGRRYAPLPRGVAVTTSALLARYGRRRTEGMSMEFRVL